jgi:hypothetical protein
MTLTETFIWTGCKRSMFFFSFISMILSLPVYDEKAEEN